MFTTVVCVKCGQPVAEYDDGQVPEMLRKLLPRYITSAGVQHPTGNPGCAAVQNFNKGK